VTILREAPLTVESDSRTVFLGSLRGSSRSPVLAFVVLTLPIPQVLSDFSFMGKEGGRDWRKNRSVRLEVNVRIFREIAIVCDPNLCFLFFYSSLPAALVPRF